MSVDTIALLVDAIALLVETMALSPSTIALLVKTMALSVDTMALSVDAIALQVDKKPDCNLTNLKLRITNYELRIALQDAGFNQGLWDVVVGRFAVKTTSPFWFSAKLVASMMRSGAGVVILLGTKGRSGLSLFELRLTKFIPLLSLSENICLF
ncbi:MAG: hypothetical protein RM368_05725 [Nostoc sp. DedSLP03]|uniref:hypothetical protein n=1 Tax=Nostoc sp. DedSLP03 TaxID=3075400 RepID=UPI002AD3E045|nr:hypothetical protein [Nostoc sp. DedSLP03]MDZ7964459.1 hypothetical protein [Nostoc sp. DedSLP03]